MEALQAIPVVNATKQKYEEGKIYRTKDWDSLQRIPGNRPISDAHVDELISLIDEEDMLAENPGIVTDYEGSFGVAAGQHRKLAAKALNKWFYFIYRPDVNVRQIRILGEGTRDWLIGDYLESIIEETGNKDYITMKEFANNYRISLPIALCLLTDEYKNRKRTNKEFELGRFEVKDFNLADRMASLLTDVRLYCIDNAWVDRRLMIALRKFLDKGIDPKKLTKKLKDYGLYVSKRNSMREYETQLEGILEFQA